MNWQERCMILLGGGDFVCGKCGDSLGYRYLYNGVNYCPECAKSEIENINDFEAAETQMGE